MVHAIVHELKQRRDYFQNNNVETVYFGGGTPSILSENELSLIFETINKEYIVKKDVEITIECNPEDITLSKLQLFERLGINRLSIGIQTFNNEILTFLNRVHDCGQAINSVKLAQDEGFENITIDLMYALPKSNLDILKLDLDQAIELNVPHISAYCFTLEEKTAFGKMAKQNKLIINEDSVEQLHYELLNKTLTNSNYEHYEISNYAKDGKYSKHNTAYWFGKNYLGIGPGAHSFNGKERQWNINNNAIYIQKNQSNEPACEIEYLNDANIFNEGLLTQLRTKWGLNTQLLLENSKIDLFLNKKQEIEKLKNSNLIYQMDNYLFLTEKGKILADGIVVELMV